MIIGIGTDLVRISRIDKVYAKFGQKFLHRSFSAEERAKAAKSHNPSKTLASRFAAKEAAAKAIGVAIRSGVRFADFSVSNDAMGKPQLHIAGKAAEILAARAPQARIVCHLSLAEESEYALAFVVISAENFD